jgi:hypothetical protein
MQHNFLPAYRNYCAQQQPQPVAVSTGKTSLYALALCSVILQLLLLLEQGGEGDGSGEASDGYWRGCLWQQWRRHLEAVPAGVATRQVVQNLLEYPPSWQDLALLLQQLREELEHGYHKLRY